MATSVRLSRNSMLVTSSTSHSHWAALMHRVTRTGRAQDAGRQLVRRTGEALVGPVIGAHVQRVCNSVEYEYVFLHQFS